MKGRGRDRLRMMTNKGRNGARMNNCLSALVLTSVVEEVSTLGESMYRAVGLADTDCLLAGKEPTDEGVKRCLSIYLSAHSVSLLPSSFLSSDLSMLASAAVLPLLKSTSQFDEQSYTGRERKR